MHSSTLFVSLLAAVTPALAAVGIITEYNPQERSGVIRGQFDSPPTCVFGPRDILDTGDRDFFVGEEVRYNPVVIARNCYARDVKFLPEPRE